MAPAGGSGGTGSGRCVFQKFAFSLEFCFASLRRHRLDPAVGSNVVVVVDFAWLLFWVGCFVGGV